MLAIILIFEFYFLFFAAVNSIYFYFWFFALLFKLESFSPPTKKSPVISSCFKKVMFNIITNMSAEYMELHYTIQPTFVYV